MIHALLTITALWICVVPTGVLYSLLGYLFVYSVMPESMMEKLAFKIGSANVYPLDIIYVSSVLALCVTVLKSLCGLWKLRPNSGPTLVLVFLAFLYLFYYSCHFIWAYFSRVPPTSLFRFFFLHAQCFYVLIPILVIRQEAQLKRLLLFLMSLAFVFPLCQIFLVGAASTQMILQGQNTLRLGHGSFSPVLAFSILALLCWERRTWLSGIPGAGLVMLAHRSAFLGVFASVLSLAFITERRFRSLLLFGVAVAGAFLVLVFIQTGSSAKVFDRGIQRIGETFQKTGTTQGRMAALRDTLRLAREYPIFGIGFRGAYELNKKEAFNAFAFNVLHPHNFLLKALSIGGIVGLSLILSIVVYALLCAHRLSRMEGRRQVGSFLFSCLLFFLTFSLMNTNFDSDGYVFWTLLGVLCWYMNEAGSLEGKTCPQ